MEERVVKDIQALAEASGDLRSRLSVVLGLALFIVALTGGLALSLIRRWVIRPVAGLRTAAARIAAGDFEHRVPIPTRAPADEMTALSTEVNHMASMVKRMQTERIEQERLAAIGELVRRLAHNLRNPLSGIRGLAELTRSDAAAFGPAADEARENQDRIIKAVDRFEGWLADLLRVTKPTRVEPAPTDVPRWLAGLVEAHRPSAQTRGITLELDTTAAPATAEFDARHLEHAVSALISNALEAATVSISGHHTARVRVSSHANHPTNGQCARSWEIRVEDTGPGIPPHIRESIFKPYFTTKKDGNGIGLASAQQVARAHGGEITVWGCREAAFDGKAFTLTGAALVIRLPLAGPTTGFDDRSG
jgi:signal transduction histidine kinase